MTGTYPIPAPSSSTTFQVDMPWQDAIFASLTEVTECLDVLENLGVREQEFLLVGDQFHVRWR